MNRTPRTRKTVQMVTIMVIVLIIPLSLLQLNRNSKEVYLSAAVFTGGKACIKCHQKEYRLWKGSDHDSAMTVASDASVKGDFRNAVFTSHGKTSRFYKRGGKFFVYTQGPGGIRKEFQVVYTFGIRPLQQYLIPFENGKFQCLPIAWNTLRKEWFDLSAMVYKPKDLNPGNWLYWTNQAQNWNGMCAECHSTNLQKNFDLNAKSYHTTWSDINVNCEACHGPGSEHIDWTSLPVKSRPGDDNKGLVVKTSKITSRQYVGACAPCHARRSSLGPFDYEHSDFLNSAVPQLITRPNYYIDGQILEEDYEYGSFTQSKMYMKGVRCGDCHDPHSLKRKFEANALCTQCHKAEVYDTFNHHKHKSMDSGNSIIDKPGSGDVALCRDCHMPGRFYMGVDKRFDHSFRIPRPGLSLKLGTPNACTNCHKDKTSQWALQFVNQWYGKKKKPHYGTLFADGSTGKKGADTGLLQIVSSKLYPDIVRATALHYLWGYHDAKTQVAVGKALNDADPLLRYTAVRNYPVNDSFTLFRSLAPLLNDRIKSVRIVAANRMMTFKKSSFSGMQYRFFQKALEEYKKSLEYVADFPAGRYDLGNFYARLNDRVKAEDNYREAIAIDNLFYPATINLAIMYYQQGKTDQAAGLFQEMITHHPEVTDGYYYLALLYGEQKKYPQAIALLEKASAKAGCGPAIFYNLGLLYQLTNQNVKCEATLVKGLRQDPENFDLLYALYAFHMKQNKPLKAAMYLEKLKTLFPNNKQVLELYNNLAKRR